MASLDVSEVGAFKNVGSSATTLNCLIREREHARLAAWMVGEEVSEGGWVLRKRPDSYGVG